jgi:hypothetical protein
MLLPGDPRSTGTKMSESSLWSKGLWTCLPSPELGQHSPEQSERAVLLGSTPNQFRRQVRKAVAMANETLERRLLLVKSWNEWAEGNYLEPDLIFGRGYLEALRDEVCA